METRPYPAILFIEHNDAIRELYLRELKRNFTVTCLRPVDANLDLQILHHMDGILLGLDMPEGLSVLLIEPVFTAARKLQIPVVAYSTMDAIGKGVTDPFTEFLVQPVLPSTLVEKMSLAIFRKIAPQPDQTVEGETE